eukprot:m.117790 g.117790  ORF g.117790 m.117790 type:complete len:536 (-) comp28606_c0_seq3:337-1944(-)
MRGMILMLFVVLGTACVPSTSEQVDAGVRFAMAYGDHMVLQSGTPAHVWGFANPSSTITVTVSVATPGFTTLASIRVDVSADGKWSAYIPTQPPSATFVEHTISAKSSSGSIATLEGVLFGDVWVCSGQSNMDHPMTSIINATAEIEAANLVGGAVRLLKVKKIASLTPMVEIDDLLGLETNWTRSSNVTVSNFSATCFLTGTMLQKHLGYPVGLIDSSWAGVAITPLSSLASCARCGVDADVACPDHNAPEPQNATSVYNNMIHPLHSTTIYGVLWWQGEASGAGCPAGVRNTTLATYYCLWQALIQDWRSRWHVASNTSASLPFGFVQLEPTANPSIRWDETAHRISVPNECLPNVFMAAALDFGDTVGGVHTRYKKPIAARLTLAARAVAYNENNVDYRGPVASSAITSADNKTITITFDYVNGTTGLALKHTTGFKVCSNKEAALCYRWANDEYFFNVTAKIGTNPNEIILSVPPGVEMAGGPRVIKYEFLALPCNWPTLEDCPVYSNGLPSPPFMLYIGDDVPPNIPCIA